MPLGPMGGKGLNQPTLKPVPRRPPPGHVLNVADTVVALSGSPLPGWCTCPSAGVSVGCHQLTAASFSKDCSQSLGSAFPSGTWEVTPYPGVREGHSQRPVQKPGLFALRGGDNSVVTFLFLSSLWDQGEVRCPICPSFLGTLNFQSGSPHPGKPSFLSKPGQLIALALN